MNINDAIKKFNSQIEKFSEMKENFCNRPGKDFSRYRKQNFEGVVRSILALDGNTLTNELLRISKYSINAPSASAFIQQREKISASVFPQLFKMINETFDMNMRYEGYRLMAVDGSHIHVPNNPYDLDSLAQSREDEHPHNEFHLNAFWDILQGTFMDAVIQKYRTQNEDSALIEMIERSKLKDVIAVCDRGYESYNNIAHLQNAGWKYVMRVKEKGGRGIADGLNIPDEPEFDMHISLSITRKQSREAKEMAKEKNKYRCIPSSIKFDYLPLKTKRNESAHFFTLEFRLVRVKISEDSYEMLMTNLPEEKFPPEKLKDIYDMRWGIETSFRDLKYIVGMLKFHSRKSEFVTQEIYANLIMYNMTAVISRCVEIPTVQRKYEYRIRFSTAVRIIKSLLAGDVSPPAAEALIQRNITPVRPNRNYPRKKQQKARIQFVYRIA